MTKLKSNWFSTFLYKQYALYLVSLTVEFRIQTTLQILYARISLMSPFLLLQILDALTTIEQVTIARVYNWDVHQRRLRQASPSAMESWVESSLPPCWQYVSIPNSPHNIDHHLICGNCISSKFARQALYTIYCGGRICYIIIGPVLIHDGIWSACYLACATCFSFRLMAMHLLCKRFVTPVLVLI